MNYEIRSEKRKIVDDYIIGLAAKRYPNGVSSAVSLPSTGFFDVQAGFGRHLYNDKTKIYCFENGHQARLEEVENARKAKFADKHNLHLYHMSVEEFTFEELLEFVFLDYCSHPTVEQLALVNSLLKSGKIKDGGTLAVTHCLGRGGSKLSKAMTEKINSGLPFEVKDKVFDLGVIEAYNAFYGDESWQDLPNWPTTFELALAYTTMFYGMVTKHYKAKFRVYIYADRLPMIVLEAYDLHRRKNVNKAADSIVCVQESVTADFAKPQVVKTNSLRWTGSKSKANFSHGPGLQEVKWDERDQSQPQKPRKSRWGYTPFVHPELETAFRATGLTQGKFAKEAGLQPSNLCNILHGCLVASPLSIQKMQTVFDRYGIKCKVGDWFQPKQTVGKLGRPRKSVRSSSSNLNLEYLDQCLNVAKITKGQLANATGISITHLSGISSGQRKITVDLATRIQYGFGRFNVFVDLEKLVPDLFDTPIQVEQVDGELFHGINQGNHRSKQLNAIFQLAKRHTSGFEFSVLYFKYVEGRSDAEIAKLIPGCSLGAVRTGCQRGIGKLFRYLPIIKQQALA
jgi:transcriptional regulator with XRE-family HTH domain